MKFHLNDKSICLLYNFIRITSNRIIGVYEQMFPAFFDTRLIIFLFHYKNYSKMELWNIDFYKKRIGFIGNQIKPIVVHIELLIIRSRQRKQKRVFFFNTISLRVKANNCNFIFVLCRGFLSGSSDNKHFQYSCTQLSILADFSYDVIRTFSILLSIFNTSHLFFFFCRVFRDYSKCSNHYGYYPFPKKKKNWSWFLPVSHAHFR